MNSYDKEYDAFEIFEEIQEAQQAGTFFQPEKIPVARSVKEKSDILRGKEEEEAIRFRDEESRDNFRTEQVKKGAVSCHAKEKSSSNAGTVGRRITSASPDSGMYYEIEYDSCSMPGVGKFVLKPQKVEAPVRDEIREIFDQMRELARERRSYSLHHSKFYDKRVQQENSRIFYEQGMFMKDFEDSYTKSVPYSTYFPYYQMMGYEQLRTYFTWRTEVRKGIVENTSLSYAYLYLYELLGNIGVESPEEGLEKLMFFWKEFRVYDASIDKYVRRWLKDYHIYYELPHSFKEFIEENDLVMYYPRQNEPADNFELFCTISKYDIRKSVFYTEDRMPLIKECFTYTLERVQTVFEENAICFDEAIFQPVKNMTVWTPFKDALFYPWKNQKDRRVVFSEKEVYICDQNRWTFQTTITTENGKKLLGYIMKQMEVVLRKLTKYKYQITADMGMVNDVVLARLKYLGISLEQVITEAVQEFYREATKTVVKVNLASLAKIRQEALQTQEKLIVPEEAGSAGVFVAQGEGFTGRLTQRDAGSAEVLAVRGEGFTGRLTQREAGSTEVLSQREAGSAEVLSQREAGSAEALSKREEGFAEMVESKEEVLSGRVSHKKAEISDGLYLGQMEEQKSEPMIEGNLHIRDVDTLQNKERENLLQTPHCTLIEENENVIVTDEWSELRNTLSKTELEALRILLSGEASLKPYADAHSIMLEVLIDGINEKAMDVVGDSLLEDEFTIYEDYIEQVKGMVEGK